MSTVNTEASSHRVATSDDIELNTYLEIAEGDRLGGDSPSVPVRTESIVILDFGSQYSRLIARRVREANVYCEIIPFDAGPDVLHLQDVKGIILSGGPNSVYEYGAPLIPSWVFDSGVPVLGICYGMQALAHQLGGSVIAGIEREYGHALLHLNGAHHPLFSRLDTSVPRLDEPRRPHQRNAARVPFTRVLGKLALRGNGERNDACLRHSVPP